MIRHILRSGEVKTITGHQISRKDNPRVYEILEKAKRGEKNGHIRTDKGGK